MNKIRIILADDHQLFRDGIKSLLSSESHIEIEKEVCSGKELIDYLSTNIIPDIVISDISMPEMTGIELTQYLTEHYPVVKVLILSMSYNFV